MHLLIDIIVSATTSKFKTFEEINLTRPHNRLYDSPATIVYNFIRIVV